MDPVAGKDFNAYLAETRSYETDITELTKKSEQRAWWVAGGAVIIALAAVIALAMLVPLKSVATVVIRVNESTGAVDVVQKLDSSKTNYEETINKYFLEKYLRCREGYSFELAEVHYNCVALMSGNDEQQRYQAYFNQKNPTSPLNIYGHENKVRVHVKSTSFAPDNPNIAFVRYYKELDDRSDGPPISHWVATITFKYSGAEMQQKDRAINPLGFQALEYRNDPDEATTHVPAPPAARATPPSLTPPGDIVLFPESPP